MYDCGTSNSAATSFASVASRIGDGDQPRFGNAARQIARIHAAETAKTNQSNIQTCHVRHLRSFRSVSFTRLLSLRA